MVQSYAGPWGYPTIFAATKPRGHSRNETAEKLRMYMAAKKHQMKSDRALGLLMDETGQIVQVIYMNDPPADDPELDELGAAIGLKPIEEHTAGSPVSAACDRRARSRRKHKGRHLCTAPTELYAARGSLRLSSVTSCPLRARSDGELWASTVIHGQVSTEPPGISHRVIEVGAFSRFHRYVSGPPRVGRPGETEAMMVEYVSGRLGLEAPSGLSDAEIRL